MSLEKLAGVWTCSWCHREIGPSLYRLDPMQHDKGCPDRPVRPDDASVAAVPGSYVLHLFGDPPEVVGTKGMALVLELSGSAAKVFDSGIGLDHTNVSVVVNLPPAVKVGFKFTKVADEEG